MEPGARPASEIPVLAASTQRQAGGQNRTAKGTWPAGRTARPVVCHHHAPGGPKGNRSAARRLGGNALGRAPLCPARQRRGPLRTGLPNPGAALPPEGCRQNRLRRRVVPPHRGRGGFFYHAFALRTVRVE